MLRRRTDVDYEAFSAFGAADDVADLIDRYVEGGATKFVARPACPPEKMMEQLELLGREVAPRYHK
jgi:alkanesulfonate monooxygenase SsuD/methylene tetrahydromethanopterin reductase-like flavin-dependent oxidoreductase (luciferase family)